VDLTVVCFGHGTRHRIGGVNFVTVEPADDAGHAGWAAPWLPGLRYLNSKARPLWSAFESLCRDSAFDIVDAPAWMWMARGWKRTLPRAVVRAGAFPASCPGMSYLDRAVLKAGTVFAFLNADGIARLQSTPAPTRSPSLTLKPIDECLTAVAAAGWKIKPILPVNEQKSIVIGDWLFETPHWERYLEAAHDLASKEPACRVIVASRDGHNDADSAGKLEQLLDQLGCRSTVWFLPQIAGEQVIGLFALADVIVLPSAQNKLSNLALDAALSGKPLVVHKDSQLLHLSTESRGFAVDTDDPRSLSRALQTILRSPEKVDAGSALHSAARAAVRARAARWLALYREVLSPEQGRLLTDGRLAKSGGRR